MPVVLQVLGGMIGVAGLLMVGFGLPIRYQNLDNTMIAAGITAVVGGLVLLGLGSVLRELRRLLRAMERTGMPAEVQGKPGRSPRVTGPIPTPIATPARAEPRLDPAIADEPAEPALAPAVVEQRQRPSIFALVRGSKTEHFEIDETEGVPLSPSFTPRAPSTMPERERVAAEESAHESRYAEARIEPRAEPARSEARVSSPAALASRTAARIDMPRSVPELPRANERGGRSLFDSVWPNEQKREPSFERVPPERPAERHPDRPLFVPEPELSREARDARDASDLAHAAVKEAFEQLSLGSAEEEPAPRHEPKLDMRSEKRPDPKPVTILKSGVIDGMAYTLYTDGSIEAQLPTGLMRFSSIEDLRTYLERNG